MLKEIEEKKLQSVPNSRLILKYEPVGNPILHMEGIATATAFRVLYTVLKENQYLIGLLTLVSGAKSIMFLQLLRVKS